MSAPAPFSLRRAEPGDLPTLVALEQATFRHDRMSPRQFRRHLAHTQNLVLLAEDAAGLLGAAVVFFRRGARRARLYSIATAAAARGRGVGRALLIAAEAAARERGMQALSLEVRHDNEAALRLYETAGYQRSATLDDYYEDGAAAWRYEKPLQADHS